MAANNIPPEPIPISQSPVPLSQIDRAPAPVPTDTTAPPTIPLSWILQAPEPVSVANIAEPAISGPSATYAIAVYANGVLLTSQVHSIDFVGNAVVTTVDRNNVTVTINSTGSDANTGLITFNGTTISGPSYYDSPVPNVTLQAGARGTATGTVTGASLYLKPGSAYTRPSGNVVVGLYNPWNFNDYTGNLIMPSNTSSINYANGQPYGGSGGGATDWANIGNINNQYGPTSIAIGQYAQTPAAYSVPQSFNGSIWTGTQFVAVGSDQNGNFVSATSPDGATWTNHFTTIPFTGLGVVYNGTNQYVAVGTNFEYPFNYFILTSTDAVNWTQQTTAPGLLIGITYNGLGQYVAVGSDLTNNSIILTSPDGVTWTPQATITSVYFNSITWNGVDQYVAVGGIYITPSPNYYYASIYTSPDGVTWTAQQEETYSYALNTVVWDPVHAQYVGVGTDNINLNALILTSSDGVTWTQQAAAQYRTDGNFNGLAVDGAGNYIATGVASGQVLILSSTDGGVTWDRQANGLTTLTANSAACDPSTDLFVTVGSGILKSIGLSSWSIVAYPAGFNNIAIGQQAGANNQQNFSLAIGESAGANFQGYSAIAIGSSAAYQNQGTRAVAIGEGSGSQNQKDYAIAIGLSAGGQSQGFNATAIGLYAGYGGQGDDAVAIGAQAGYDGQGNNAVAIGVAAGFNAQGNNSIAIGTIAGENSQPANTIILNATGVELNGVANQTDSFYVAPVRNDTSNVTNALYYNTDTFEISYGPGGGSSAAAGNAGDIQINVAGNIGADSTLRYVNTGGEMTLYADYLNAPGIFTSDIYAGDGTPSNITLTTSYGNATWTFGADGNLSAPGNISTVGTVTAHNLIQAGIGNVNGYNAYFANNITAQGTLQATGLVIPAGSGTFYGNTTTGVDALFAGVPGYTQLGSNVVAQFAANVNSYAQINLQNLSTGDLASADYIITADIGNNSAYYLDLGLASSTHNDPYFFGDVGFANDGYLTVVGPTYDGPSTSSGPGNLVLGSSNGLIKMFVGNASQANVIATVSSTGLDVVGNITTTGTSGNITGANVISANLFVTTGFGGDLTMSGGNVTGANVVTANTFIGNGSQLTGVATAWANIGNINNANGPQQIAIGQDAGAGQGAGAVAVGTGAGANTQGSGSVAIGDFAGNQNQGLNSVAIGESTGTTTQGNSAVAIGVGAGGTNQGIEAIAIGASAGETGQGNNSIILNATGSTLNQTTANTFTVKPIRNATGTNALYYDASSGEITYDTSGGSYGDSNVASFLGAFGSNTIVTSGTANVGAINIPGTIAWPDTSNVFVDSGLHIYGNLGLDMSSPNNVAIIANANTWTFDTAGNLSIPGGGAVWNIGNGTVGITANILNPQTVNLGLDYAGNSATLSAGNIVTIQLATGTQQWNFYGNALMTAPGAISAAGNITGANVITSGSGGDVTLTGGNITGANVITANTITANSLFNGTSNISIIANSSIQMFTPAFDTNLGAVNLVGTTNGNSVAPQNPGVMLHLTGVTGTPARIYNDSVANYAGFIGRRYDGTADAPAAISANAVISRYAATPYTSAGWPTISTARIDMVTTEAQTATNQGTEIQFWTTSLGSNTIAKVMSMTNNDIKINGDLATTGNATFSTNPNYVNNITVSGTAYDASMVIDDVGADHVAQLILNRSSTSVQPILATALNNSDDPTANVDVVLGQTLFQLATLGFAGTDYKEFGGIAVRVDDSGTVSETSSPGLIELRVTPDGSTSTNTALTIRNDSSAEFAGNVTVDQLLITTPVTLGTLTAVAGARAFINDANLVAAGNFGAQITGGAGNTVPVWSDGSNWYIG